MSSAKTSRPYRVFISAAEASSDQHAAILLTELKKLAPIDAYGIGGPALVKAGLVPWEDSRSLLSMGFLEVLGRLPKILRLLSRVARRMCEHPADLALVVDYPDFHFQLIKRIAGFCASKVYYIPPKVWAWRAGRTRFLQRHFNEVLSILPFEVDFLRQRGVPATYVGSPLYDELPLRMTRLEARRKIGIGSHSKAIAVFLGSRPAEFKRHLDPALDACVRLAAQLRSEKILAPDEVLEVLLPIAASVDGERLRQRISQWLRSASGGSSAFILKLHLIPGDQSAVTLKAADVGLVKSGTSTLEAAFLDCPHVLYYRPHPMSCWIVKNIIRYDRPVGLTNLALGRGLPTDYAVPELLCARADADSLASEVRALWLSDEAKRLQLRDFESLRELFSRGLDPAESPSKRAAQRIFNLLQATAKTTRGEA